MPGPLDVLGGPVGGASKPLSKALGALDGDKPPKTQLDKDLEKVAIGSLPVLLKTIQLYPVTASYVTRPALGLDFTKPGLPKLTSASRLYVAPQPLGVVPPAVYGLPPGYVRKLAPSLPESTYLHTAPPTPEQMRRYELQNFKNTSIPAGAVQIPTVGTVPDARPYPAILVDFLARQREGVNEFLSSELRGGHTGLLGPVVVSGGLVMPTAAAGTVPTAPAAAVPAAGLVRPTGAPGTALDPFRTAVPSGSLQPEKIDPPADAARRNRDGAEGINRELVHERADP